MNHSHELSAYDLIARIEEAGLRAFSYRESRMATQRYVAVRISEDDDDTVLPRGHSVAPCGRNEIWYWADLNWPKDVMEKPELEDEY